MEQELLPTCDREVFQRVWNRVMPQDREGCPIVLESAEEALPAVMVKPAEETEAPCLCLGEASAAWGDQLRAFIDQELAGQRRCQLLTRRVQGSGSRSLAALAADKRRRAKRLSTAYFLISGVRYWPAVPGDGMPLQPVPVQLREEFRDCQRGAAAYRAAGAGTADSCLEELFQECAQECESHAWTIRGVLEGL